MNGAYSKLQNAHSLHTTLIESDARSEAALIVMRIASSFLDEGGIESRAGLDLPT